VGANALKKRVSPIGTTHKNPGVQPPLTYQELQSNPSVRRMMFCCHLFPKFRFAAPEANHILPLPGQVDSDLIYRSGVTYNSNPTAKYDTPPESTITLSSRPNEASGEIWKKPQN
jgi:hypothetical protein